LALRNRSYARGRAHVESYGSAPVIVYEPEHPADEDLSAGTTPKTGRHGNFFDTAYAAIAARPEWMRRFDKIHAQAGRSLPKSQLDPSRRWRELDSCMSSDALLMNIFCSPGVAESAAVRNALGVDTEAIPIFGWKARVPLANRRFDRTEVDLRLGSLLVEAKLTEADFQSRSAAIVESYRDLDEIFDRDRLPRVEIATKRRMHASEFPENVSQELESLVADPALFSAVDASFRPPGEEGYAGYQLIRNVLAAHAAGCNFCVLHDERRPDLREEWFQVMAAVKSADLRVRLKVMTWQELAAFLPAALQKFLDLKYGIVAPGRTPSPIGEAADLDD
jgi:Restriction Endonuclease associating with ARP